MKICWLHKYYNANIPTFLVMLAQSLVLFLMQSLNTTMLSVA